MPRSAHSTLSHAEWEIMNAVWELGEPVSVRQVGEHEYPDGQKAYTTVQTLMNILVGKGQLVCDRSGPRHLYRPARGRDAVLQHEMRSFVDLAFRGSFGAMASFLIAGDTLNPEEIAHLRDLVDGAAEAEPEEGG